MAEHVPIGRCINFRVDDRVAMVDQLRAAGIDVEGGPARVPVRRFAQLADPDANAVLLWRPM